MGELLGTLPQWITSVSIITFIGLLLKHRLDSTVNLRKHWADELERLTNRISAEEQRGRECIERERDLRNRLTVAEDEISGLKRQISRYSADQLMILEKGCVPVRKAEKSRDAAHRIQDGDKNAERE